MKEVANSKPSTSDGTRGSTGTATVVQETTQHELVSGAISDKNPDSETSSLGANNNATEFEFQGSEFVFGEKSGTDAQPALNGSYTNDELNLMFPNMRRENQAEVIIGADNRTRINPPSSYPWRAICALKITAKNGKRFIGTGWLVGPRTVITAGHCVYMHNEGGWAASIEVIPALNDSSRPFGSAVSSNLRSVTGWTSSRNRDNDYGAIILPPNNRLGDVVGFFGVAVRNDSFLSSAALNLSGYPGDKGGNQQWFMAQRASSISSRVLTYQIDTVGGQSGAPVWVLQSGNRYAVGIHTNGHSSGNSATRIVTAVYNNIISWKAEAP